MAKVAQPQRKLSKGMDMSRFQTMDTPSVACERNFNRCRQGSLKTSSLHQMKAGMNAAEVKASETGVDELQSGGPPMRKNSSAASLASRRRSSAFSSMDSESPSQVWSWPLGDVDVRNTDESFEATFDFRPFSADEVSARVMGSDLQIECRQEGNSEKKGEFRREIYRTYQLPLNIDPRTVNFTIKKQEGKLVINAMKITPLQMQVAVFSLGADLLQDDVIVEENDD